MILLLSIYTIINYIFLSGPPKIAELNISNVSDLFIKIRLCSLLIRNNKL
jgi:hypothetical protein